MEKGERNHRNIYLCLKIFGKIKKNMDEETKVAQVEIKFRNHALHWFMILVVKIPHRSHNTIVDAKKALDNKFQ
jgi:hypothetical protein